MTVERLLVVAALGLAVPLAAQLIPGSRGEPAVRTLMASWAETPADLEETAASAEQVVLGRVTRVRPGDDIVVQVAGEPDGVDRIPVEIITIQVDKSYKAGQRGPATTIEVFHTGRSAGRDVVTMMDDPPYQRGEQYVMFLKPGPEVGSGGARVASQRLVSPEGRYRVRGGRIEPVTDRGFAPRMRGRSLTDFEGELNRAAGRRPSEGAGGQP